MAKKPLKHVNQPFGYFVGYSERCVAFKGVQDQLGDFRLFRQDL